VHGIFVHGPDEEVNVFARELGSDSTPRDRQLVSCARFGLSLDEYLWLLPSDPACQICATVTSGETGTQ
jgi:hypothetical protein